MSGEGVRVPFSWQGSAFHTYLSMTEGPMRQVLTVKNLPPPLFSEGTFITVHWDQTPLPGCPPSRPPGSSARWEIQATSGRYASYWNAYLFLHHFAKL